MKNILFLMMVLIAQTIHGQDKVDADYVFTNASIITMAKNEVLNNKNIFVKDGKIVAITNTNTTVLKAKKTINLRGKFLMPALADAHVHLPKNEAELHKFFVLNLLNGVTKVRSMRGNWNHIQWRTTYNKSNSFYPKLYLASPPISRKYTMSDDQLATYMKSAKEFDFIKVLSIKDETTFKKLVEACEKYDVKLAGHFPKNIADNLIFNSPYTSFEHLGGLAVAQSLLNKRLYNIKKNDIYICPTLSWYSVGSGRYSYDELRTLAGMEYIPKTTVTTWISKTKVYREKIGVTAYREEVKNELAKLDRKYAVIKKIHAMGIKMLLSPDSSSKYMVNGFGMVDEMKLLKNADLTNYEILEMATQNFAEFFNGNYGVIEQNKDADFIILNSNPLEDLDALRSIDGVFYNSQYLDKKMLQKLSKEILPN